MHWLPIGLLKSDFDVDVEQANDGDRRRDLPLETQLRIPCPAIELISVATILGDNNGLLEIKTARAFERLLRQSPALMLFGFSRYREKLNRSPESTAKFISWCKLNLIRELSECEIGVHDPFDSEKETGKQFAFDNLHGLFESFLAARNNRELRRALRKFVSAFSELTKRQAKSLVKHLVGKSVSPEEIRCKRVRRVETRWQIIDSWRSQIDFDVTGVIAIALNSSESALQFESRLQVEKLAAMKQLAYGASHEINNPLANIATRAQTMLVTEKDVEKRNKLVVIYEQSIRAHEMISDMMLFAHPPAIKPVVVDVRLMVRKTMNELKPLLEFHSGVEVAVTVGVGVDRMEADVTQISVAVRCLIKNSLEAVRTADNKSGRVEVRFDLSDTGIEISVWDNGLAITKDVKRHLFDPFYSSREAGRGLGFGLSKVWTITNQHGGSIRLDEENKRGTRFVISLPQSAGLSRRPSEASGEITICTNSKSAEEDAA